MILTIRCLTNSGLVKMNLLLDTQCFIWWDEGNPRLSKTVHAAILDRSNLLLLSMASVWEMEIKLRLGKLTIQAPLDEELERQQTQYGLQILSITLEQIFTIKQLRCTIVIRSTD